jgi:hypothetical protein
MHEWRAGGDEHLVPAHQIDAVLGTPHAKRLRQPPGTRAEEAIISGGSVPAHQLDAVDRFDRSEQNRAPLPPPPGHDVHAEVHPLREIDVQVPGGSEHDLRPRSQSPKRVAGRVILLIGLGLDDPPHEGSLRKRPNQEPSEKIPSDHDRRPRVERARERAERPPRGQRLPF